MADLELQDQLQQLRVENFRLQQQLELERIASQRYRLVEDALHRTKRALVELQGQVASIKDRRDSSSDDGGSSMSADSLEPADARPQRPEKQQQHPMEQQQPEVALAGPRDPTKAPPRKTPEVVELSTPSPCRCGELVQILFPGDCCPEAREKKARRKAHKLSSGGDHGVRTPADVEPPITEQREDRHWRHSDEISELSSPRSTLTYSLEPDKAGAASTSGQRHSRGRAHQGGAAATDDESSDEELEDPYIIDPWSGIGELKRNITKFYTAADRAERETQKIRAKYLRLMQRDRLAQEGRLVRREDKYEPTGAAHDRMSHRLAKVKRALGEIQRAQGASYAAQNALHAGCGPKSRS
eukprot:m.24665 g.24665  ORF g.24665 m.24665 type:complete len:356 (-) comp4314_c0_seq1:25-1092(-)